MSTSNLTASDFIQFYRPTTPILFDDLKDLPFVNVFDYIPLERTASQKRLEVDITKVLLNTDEVVDEQSHYYYDCFLTDDGYIDYVLVVRDEWTMINNSMGVLSWILYEVL